MVKTTFAAGPQMRQSVLPVVAKRYEKGDDPHLSPDFRVVGSDLCR
jgi:hypothetical protein